MTVGADELRVDLMDGRTIIVPIAWFRRLEAGAAEQRARWELAGAGCGIHWPDLDEDVSTEELLRRAGRRSGARSPRPADPRFAAAAKVAREAAPP